ncbi:hypothetical protein D5F01_LYC24258 [Larimichthys crocea]|uniref:Uncharacterized protein n=1 Tax=Larimichthys crocea TaxID=215358 RepID=A0A6G0HEX2_LARCR|nr:hypothetical protein D5F01_LYC24258 [Larimichthys crocea]
MNRKKTGRGAFESLISTSKDLLRNKLSIPSNKHILNANRFKGQLGATITVITSLIVGFLTIPNNILYFIDNKHGVTTSGAGHREPSPSSRPDNEYVYIHAGIALITLGCLAMIVSIVLSYFAAKSKRKMYASEGPRWDAESTKTSRTVMACLIMMNVELFMAVIAGCMELLYLTSDQRREQVAQRGVHHRRVQHRHLRDGTHPGQRRRKLTGLRPPRAPSTQAPSNTVTVDNQTSEGHVEAQTVRDGAVENTMLHVAETVSEVTATEQAAAHSESQATQDTETSAVKTETVPMTETITTTTATTTKPKSTPNSNAHIWIYVGTAMIVFVS